MSEEIIDLREFMERVQDDRDLMIELLDIFQQDFAEKRKVIDGAVQSKNFEQIRSIAHSLKGSSGNISAKTMHASWFQIEQLAKNSDVIGIAEVLGQLDKMFKELETYAIRLKSELKK